MQKTSYIRFVLVRGGIVLSPGHLSYPLDICPSPWRVCPNIETFVSVRGEIVRSPGNLS